VEGGGGCEDELDTEEDVVSIDEEEVVVEEEDELDTVEDVVVVVSETGGVGVGVGVVIVGIITEEDIVGGACTDDGDSDNQGAMIYDKEEGAQRKLDPIAVCPYNIKGLDIAHAPQLHKGPCRFKDERQRLADGAAPNTGFTPLRYKHHSPLDISYRAER